MLRTLPDSSVNVVVTSPPYWALRSYCKDEAEKAHELGREKAPDCLGWATGNRCGECHICRMVAVFHEVRRVLRVDGVCWVDYGDCYASQEGRGAQGTTSQRIGRQNVESQEREASQRPPDGLQAGSMVGIPWRFALAMQADGWCLRQDLVWAKPAPMPESVNGWRWERCRVKLSKMDVSRDRYDRPVGLRAGGNVAGTIPTATWRDCPGCPKCSATGGYVLRQGAWRCTKAHEYVFMFTKDMDYFCDAEAAKESTAGSNTHSKGTKRDPPKENAGHKAGNGHEGFCALTAEMLPSRNPRDVLNIGPDPFRGAHFACFPRELPRRLIR
jgi:site-specific DNA-methyltransferase (adenine-specific)